MELQRLQSLLGEITETRSALMESNCTLKTEICHFQAEITALKDRSVETSHDSKVHKNGLILFIPYLISRTQ